MTASIQPPESRPEHPDRTRAWLEVANARTVAASAGVPLLPMVKANGYGLGAVECARALESVQPWGYGVATWPEAAELRAAGIERPLIVFTPWMPGVEGGEVPGARPVIGDVASLEAFLTSKDTRPFHLEIDTGMSRAGIRWTDQGALQRAAELLTDAPGWEGVFTHFHSSEADLPATETQWDRFVEALCWFPRRPPFVHAANSAASLMGKVFAGDLVRPGIFLYATAAKLHARVVALRSVGPGEGVSYNETWRAEAPVEVATLALGYADGVLRSGSSRLRVEIGGEVVPVVGRITMDMTMVAVPAGTVRLGDVATIFGGAVSLTEHAAALGTNVYEALTAIGPRIPRVHR